ncbi:hypothetical protein [Duganella sp. S19_KUP01_CR8]|uniref:hypothetical protein n=1 Tax=Duganella sp. S19_KUP01_CR8 TaxID=3025502 RepID=UPI002FCDCA06
MMREFEKWVARVLLLNSALALGVCLGLLGEPQPADALPLLYSAAMLGFLSAVLSLKRWKTGLWGGVLYYALQLFSIYPFAGGWQFAVKAGVSIGLVLRFAGGVVVLNMVALALLAATAAVLAWRYRVPNT